MLDFLYGLCIGLSYVSLIAVALVLSKLKLHIKRDHLGMFIILDSVLSLFGGKIMSMVSSGDFSRGFFSTGLSSYGGLIGGIIAGVIMWIFTKRREFLDIAVLALPLMYAVGKIGCHVAGCCYGIPMDGGIYNKYAECNVFPVQITETAVFLVIFAIAFFMYLTDKKNTIPFVLIISALAKGGLDFLRDGHDKELISINQKVSIAAIVATVIFTIIWRIANGQSRKQKQI